MLDKKILLFTLLPTKHIQVAARVDTHKGSGGGVE